MPLGYRLLADVIVLIHVAYAAFVVVGQLLIWQGAVSGWRFTRNRWFRGLHLLAIGVVALEAAAGYECPLTTWERQLRELSGVQPDRLPFMPRLLRAVLFIDLPAWAFPPLHVGFASLVLATLWLYPPHWRPDPAGKAP